MSIIISSLSKSFGGRTVLEGLSLELPERGTVVISGGSGVGKTTLLRIIAGLDKKYGGSLLGMPEGGVSYAFQEHRLFPGITTLENVALVFPDEKSEVAIATASEMLDRLGIGKEEQALFPSELSGGMRQRVSLARAFVKKAPILILDEPFKELDPSLVDRVAEIIEKEARERLVLLVTHEFREKIISTDLTVSL